MAVEIFNDVCLNPICRRKHVVLTCDHCGNNVDTLYQYEGDDLCKNCFIEILLDTTEYSVISVE